MYRTLEQGQVYTLLTRLSNGFRRVVAGLVLFSMGAFSLSVVRLDDAEGRPMDSLERWIIAVYVSVFVSVIGLLTAAIWRDKLVTELGRALEMAFG